VTSDDYEAFQKALAGHKHAELKRYPELNHLFIRGQGQILPAEYSKKGFVEEAVVDDIARWVKQPR
jgi:hypothetical protein